MSRPDGRVASFADDLGDASNVLLLAPPLNDGTDEGCVRLLFPAPPSGTDVLCVTLTQSPDERMDAWEAHGVGRPAKTGVVDVGDPARSAAADSGTAVETPDGEMTIETVSSPGDLTGIGIKISSFLSEWADDGNRIAVCFHSLTTLLQYVDLQDAFRFLHVLTGRFSAVNAIAHYHMDPTAHDEREINTLTALFDAVLELDDDGEWVVRTR